LLAEEVSAFDLKIQAFISAPIMPGNILPTNHPNPLLTLGFDQQGKQASRRSASRSK
jgi:hypothetical protein